MAKKLVVTPPLKIYFVSDGMTAELVSKSGYKNGDQEFWTYKYTESIHASSTKLGTEVPLSMEYIDRLISVGYVKKLT